MIGFCPLASGSKGNCIYFGTEKTKILIDMGISLRMLEQRLAEIGVDPEEIDAVLITHEHGDHIKGIPTLFKKYQTLLFANSETAKATVESLKCDALKFKIFSTGETFEFEDLQIHPFSVQHDTLDPVGFTIRINDFKIGFCTDLGFATTLVKSALKECDYLYLEANHQPSMVYSCSRPLVYKQRVLSRQGHLSNEACAELLLDLFHPNLKHVHLAHLSSECNHPDLALEIISAKLMEHDFKTEISIAYQDCISKSIIFSMESQGCHRPS
jgi:phosphoribosyl 1,2-cyclic phosphodiesterase